jgi:hypothetical protein
VFQELDEFERTRDVGRAVDVFTSAPGGRVGVVVRPPHVGSESGELVVPSLVDGGGGVGAHLGGDRVRGQPGVPGRAPAGRETDHVGRLPATLPRARDALPQPLREQAVGGGRPARYAGTFGQFGDETPEQGAVPA